MSSHSMGRRSVTFAVLLALLLIPGTAGGGVDEDGDLDVVFATVNAMQSRVCLGNGSGGVRL